MLRRGERVARGGEKWRGTSQREVLRVREQERRRGSGVLN